MGASAASILNRLLYSRTHKAQTQPTSAKALTNTVLNLLKRGDLHKAVSVLFASPIPFPYSLYARLFQICSATLAIVETRKVESHLVTFSRMENVGPLLMQGSYLRKCLNGMGGSWNVMITAYAHGRCPKKAMLLFSEMNGSGVYASEVTFASVLGCCGAVLALLLSRQIHGLIVKYGFRGNFILESSLVDVYGKCQVIDDARKMFNEIENPTAVSWNVIVRRYLEMDDGKEAVFMFFQMFPAAVRPLNFTYSNALIACSRISALKEGMQIHGVAIKVGFEDDQVVTSSLIDD